MVSIQKLQLPQRTQVVGIVKTRSLLTSKIDEPIILTMSWPESEITGADQSPYGGFPLEHEDYDLGPQIKNFTLNGHPFLNKAAGVAKLLVRVPTSERESTYRFGAATAISCASTFFARNGIVNLDGINLDWRTLGAVALVNLVMGISIWKDTVGFMAHQEPTEQSNQ